jgi:hypothetical protein
MTLCVAVGLRFAQHKQTPDMPQHAAHALAAHAGNNGETMVIA